MNIQNYKLQTSEGFSGANLTSVHNNDCMVLSLKTKKNQYIVITIIDDNFLHSLATS